MNRSTNEFECDTLGFLFHILMLKMCFGLCGPLQETNFRVTSTRGVMVKAMNCGIVVREFVLQSHYYFHFRANTPWERYEPPYSPSSYG